MFATLRPNPPPLPNPPNPVDTNAGAPGFPSLLPSLAAEELAAEELAGTEALSCWLVEAAATPWPFP